LYIDSNIFIFATVNRGRLGRNCSEIIRLINEKKSTCASSFLVIDEVICVLQRKIRKESSIKIAKAILSMPIKWINIDKSVIIKIIETYEKTALDPKDAIHASAMEGVGLSVIVSEDEDFDNVKDIERLSASECVERYC